ncbi:MAG: DUF3021 family protein [Clostridia bacterium]|nr:DUF3021 family protein [Clostridia bacterium]
MREYIIKFLHRGLVFGGFGPIVVGIVYLCISEATGLNFSGKEMLFAILSGYFIAFIHAGASVFNEIETWSPAKSLFLHLFTLYITYIFFYLVNSWLPFEPKIVLLFTILFILIYLIIWLIVFISVRTAAARLDKSIKG